MAKRYHSSKRSKASMHEERGMERHLRGPVKHMSGYMKESHGGKMDPEHFHEPRHGMEYVGTDPRRTFEMQEAGMIHMDHRAIANLPQDVMIKPYPKTGPYLPEGLDDTISGVDHQMDYDDSKRAKTFYPKKV
jgi:hypothetical protein